VLSIPPISEQRNAMHEYLPTSIPVTIRNNNCNPSKASHQLSALCLANSRTRRRRTLGRNREIRTSCDGRSGADDGVLRLDLGRRRLEKKKHVSKIPQDTNLLETSKLTAVTVLTTFVTPLYSVLVDTDVTVVTRSTVTTIVLGAAVVQAVAVCHLVVSGSVMVTVLLSRPRFSITRARESARRAERAARKAARSLSRAAWRRAASRRRGRGLVAGVEVGVGVSKAAAWTTVGVMLQVGSWWFWRRGMLQDFVFVTVMTVGRTL
jgi:hypothetical protein